MTLEEYRDSYIKEDILPEAASRNSYPAEVFMERAVETMHELFGMSADITPCFDERKTGDRKFKKMRVDGACLDLSTNSLHLVLVDFNEGAPETITRDGLEGKAQLLINFFENMVKGYYEGGEMSNPPVALAHDVRANLDSLCKVHFYVVSTNVLGGNVKSLNLGKHSIESQTLEYELDVLDFKKIFRAISGASAPAETEIRCEDYGIKGIPCIRADIGTDQYESYLAVVPGEFLASIYKKFNGAILESNVRSFLKFNGGVNKGIRDTIRDERSRFFTYNNGISTTAKSITVERDQRQGLLLTSFKGLQIINGGQTTATLAATSIKDKAPLDGIFVQMKLTVVDKADPELVRNIARYSNKQNAVKDADLNSSHPFYVRMKTFSDRTFAPVSGLVQPIWFFERARGEYEQPMMQMTKAEVAKYKQLRPKSMLFKVVDIAKYMLTALEYPYFAAWGGEVCGRKFQLLLEKMWNKDESQFDQQFYKELVAKKILFEHIGKRISEQDWYLENGAYRPQLIEYTFAKIVHEAAKEGLAINYAKIWDRQSVPSSYDADIRKVSKLAYDCLYDPNRSKSNIETYSKTEECWKKMIDKKCELSKSLLGELVSKTETEVRKKLLGSMNVVAKCETDTDIFNLGAAYWKNILANENMSESDRKVVKAAADYAALKILSLTKRQVADICDVWKKRI